MVHLLPDLYNQFASKCSWGILGWPGSSLDGSLLSLKTSQELRKELDVPGCKRLTVERDGQEAAKVEPL